MLGLYPGGWGGIRQADCKRTNALGREGSRCKGPVGGEKGVSKWGCRVVTKTVQWLCRFLVGWLWVSHSPFPGSTSPSVKWEQQHYLPYRDAGRVEGVTMATLRQNLWAFDEILSLTFPSINITHELMRKNALWVEIFCLLILWIFNFFSNQLLWALYGVWIFAGDILFQPVLI